MGIPSVAAITETLQLIRAGELRGLAPGLNSVRDFARTLGFNESTLRTAFLTPGRQPSTRTMARLDAAIRQNITELAGRERRVRTIRDSGVAYNNPLARHYLLPPPDTRKFRLLILTPNLGYQGYRTVTVEDPGISVGDAMRVMEPDEQLVEVVWHVGEQ